LARALIVGCGCRGRALGRGLAEQGWQVRGTTRERERSELIADAGIEPVIADPDRADSILDLVGDVTHVFWLLGSATGTRSGIAGLHGPRLGGVLRGIVDTPVRGFVYEAAGALDRGQLDRGAGIVREAGATWRIPFEVVKADPGDAPAWTEAMLTAARRLATGAG
jgi:uncharacterized protein YbjT (DUF2867 family)